MLSPWPQLPLVIGNIHRLLNSLRPCLTCCDSSGLSNLLSFHCCSQDQHDPELPHRRTGSQLEHRFPRTAYNRKHTQNLYPVAPVAAPFLVSSLVKFGPLAPRTARSISQSSQRLGVAPSASFPSQPHSSPQSLSFCRPLPVLLTTRTLGHPHEQPLT